MYSFDWRGFKGPVFSGRPRGEQLRKINRLDEIESQDGFLCQIRFPNDTLTITSSFLLGLFTKSIQHFGRNVFLEKYTFCVSNELKGSFSIALDYAIDAALADKGVLIV